MNLELVVDQEHETVIVGAGPAGLGVSHLLGVAGRRNVVLERGSIGQSWRSQRWDSFRVNTVNRYNTLPGDPGTHRDPEAFMGREEVVRWFETYAEERRLPVRTNVEVVLAEPGSRGGFVLHLAGGEVLRAENLVVCTGTQVPRIPTASRDAPAHIHQVHTANYRAPEALPDGGVLIVGGGQSGLQLAEELVGTGRRTWLCTSRVARLARRYRGRDIFEWLYELGIMGHTSDDHMPLPQISGTEGGHTISLQLLARRGVVLLGKLVRIEGDRVELAADDVLDNVAFADAFSAKMKRTIDVYIRLRGVAAPPAQGDAAERPFDDGERGRLARQPSLDLRAEGITSIVWCTGFEVGLDWLRLPVFDEAGTLRHGGGISDVPGLYFLGLPWMRSRNSGTIHSVEEDARAIVEHLCSRAKLVSQSR
jgi:putative flavoprotein involved in K+ transport